MKIALITEVISLHSGSKSPVELGEYLAGKNQVTIIAYQAKSDQGLLTKLKKRGIKIFLIKPYKIPLGKFPAAFKCLPVLKHHQLISFHGSPATFLVAKISGIPIVTTYYGTQLNAYLEKFTPDHKPNLKDCFLNRLGNQIILLVQKTYLNLSSQVIAISRYTAWEAWHLYRKKIPFIYLGVNPLSGNHRRPTVNRRPGVTILSVSRLTPYKGFHLLIQAVKKTGRRVNLQLVGSIPRSKYLTYLNKIKSAQTKIGVNISQQKLSFLYRQCDFYATCDRYLFFGLPPVEAALSGKPTVALNYCAAREIIKHQQTGLVAENLNQFVRYLKTLIDNPPLRHKMGQQAKKRAERFFSWPRALRQYQRLFNNVIK